MKRDYQYDLLKSKNENSADLIKHDEQFNLLPVAPKQERFNAIAMLSSREFEIMHLTLSGVSITEIAIKIFLSPAGIKWRLSQIYNEFGVKNRLELINKATREGLRRVVSQRQMRLKKRVNQLPLNSFLSKALSV